MKRIVAVVLALGVAFSLTVQPASATSVVVYHGDNWGRLVDGPNGYNTLVYACDGENDEYGVATEAKVRSRRTGETAIIPAIDYHGANNGCASIDTTEDKDGYWYAYGLRVCETRSPWYCTNWY